MLELTRKKYQETAEYHRNNGYDPNMANIWRNNMPDIFEMFDKSKTAEELIDRVDRAFLYSINFAPENAQNTGVWKTGEDKPHIREKHIDWLLNHLNFDINSLPANVQESLFTHHRNRVSRNNRILSGNFLRTLSISQQIFKFIGKVKNVLELGGGAGHQARTYLLQVPDAKYTIIDLPETLIFSFTHLSLCFPEKKLLWVTSDEDINNIDEFDIVFIPAVFAPKLYGREYDLFINTASMGEMNNQTIHKWMDFIQNKVVVKALYTLNRFLNTVDSGHDYRKNENECSTSYDHKWNIKQWELEPTFTRSPYIDTLHSRYVEIIATRPDTQENYKERSEKLLQEVMDEDWVRLEGMYGNGIMQYRNNILVNDMTVTGTLFKLWQSLRLHQSVKGCELMLKYLDRLTVGSGNYKFEEVMYYEGLLNRLKNS